MTGVAEHTNITIRRLLESTDLTLRRAERAVSSSPKDVDAWKDLLKAANRAGKRVLIPNYNIHIPLILSGVYDVGESSDNVDPGTGWDAVSYFEFYGGNRRSLKYFAVAAGKPLFTIVDR